MKKILLFGSIFLCVTFSNAQNIEFVSKIIDYGTIDHNSDGNREFVFTNTGDKPLIIKSAKGSCGCTVPSYKKEDGSSEWAPGESGRIQVKYATNRIGNFKKTITLVTNTPDKKPVILTIKGNVLSPEEEVGAPDKENKGPIEN
tara:strand:- start:11147 stop:11578 length:432 start_codon:yes stop_codon:yes gene_type:complete